MLMCDRYPKLKHLKPTIAAITALSFLMSGLSVSAFEIELNQNMYIRTEDTKNSDVMDYVSTLKKGSIVSIPDTDVKNIAIKNGKIDIAQTLKNIEASKQAGSKFPGTFEYSKRPEKKEVYFKIQVVKAAPGSTAKVGDTNFMALEFLNRRGNAFTTSKDAELLAPKAALKPAIKSAVESAIHPDLDPKVKASLDALVTAREAKLESTTSAGCLDCLLGTSTPADKNLSDLKQAAQASNQEAKKTSEVTAAKPASPAPASVGEDNHFQGLVHAPKACEAFIEPDGKLGKFGKMAEKDIKSHPDFMHAQASLGPICPNFSKFSDAEKTHFWVYVIAAVSAQESSCSATAVNKDHPNAVGLLQQERHPKWFRSFVLPLDSDCFKSQFDPANNLSCGIDNISRYVVSKDRPLYERSSHNYFQSLMDPPTQTISKGIIASYKDCGSSQIASAHASGHHSAHHHHKAYKKSFTNSNGEEVTYNATN